MKKFLAILLASTIPLALSSCSNTISLDEAKQGITKLYSEYSTQCAISTQSCKEFFVTHSYPGLYDFSLSRTISVLNGASNSSIGSSGSFGFSPSNPDLTGLKADPEWTVPSTLSCSNKDGLPTEGEIPKGETFVWQNGEYPVHATYLDGNWYFYEILALCFI
jgi:uncharacterized protein YceK